MCDTHDMTDHDMCLVIRLLNISGVWMPLMVRLYTTALDSMESLGSIDSLAILLRFWFECLLLVGLGRIGNNLLDSVDSRIWAT